MQTQDDMDELSWLYPPSDPHDVAGWDQYWLGHINHGIGPTFMDMFCRNSALVRVMNKEKVKNILCAGNGISQEPKALAAAGMNVVALDLSPQASEIAKNYPFPSEAIAHYLDPKLQKPGGQVEFITGDILDPAVCPGLYDVIIERLTAQNYYRHDMGTFLQRLADRLSPNGIFFTHSHDGGWRPPADPRHFSRDWLRENGWTMWSGTPGRKPAGQVAWLFTSTG